MNKWKLIVSCLMIILLISFAIILLNQFVQLADFLYRIHPILGQVFFLVIIIIYLAGILLPLFVYLSMPKALPKPPLENSPEYAKYLEKLVIRLKKNIHLRNYQLDPSNRANVQEAIKVLDLEAEKEIKDTSQKVFLFTAISQYGRLDGLIVLVILFRLTFKIAMIYNQRPSLRDIITLYLNVLATVFLVSEMENLEILETQLEPILAEVGSAATLAAGTANLSNILANSIIQGAANSFLALRIGYIAKHYSSPLIAHDRWGVLHSATVEAAKMLGNVLATCVGRLTKTVLRAGQKAVWGRMVSGTDKIFGKVGEIFSINKKKENR